MSFVPRRPHRAAILAAALAGFVMWPCVGTSQTSSPSTATFSAGTREIFALDLSSTPLGTFPRVLDSLRGKMSVVMKDGVRMLKAAEPSEFVVKLSENLPDAFTIEFEITPKACCNPEDLSFEGTRAISRSPASMHVEWHPETVIAVGGGPNVQVPMPEEIKVTLPSQLTKVDVTFDAGNFKLFTNGKPVPRRAGHR
jgi:hypothetical protein